MELDQPGPDGETVATVGKHAWIDSEASYLGSDLNGVTVYTSDMPSFATLDTIYATAGTLTQSEDCDDSGETVVPVLTPEELAA